MNRQSTSPIPANETERLETLREYDILDTEYEQAFDDLAALASYICETPVSAISLLDKDRQWFKASVGLEERETPRDISFCQHAILEDEILVVPDAANDVRFKDSPLVTEGLKLQFYAGVPLVAPNGSAVGVLCVNDVKPRKLTEAQTEALKRLARQTVAQLELRKKNAALARQAQDLQEATRQAIQAEAEMKVAMEELRKGEERFHLVCKATNDVVWDLDLKTKIAWLSPNYKKLFAARPNEASPTLEEWMASIHPEDRERVMETFKEALREGASGWQAEYRLRMADGAYADVLDRAFVSRNEEGQPTRMIGAVSDLTLKKQAETDRSDREQAERANLAKSEFLSRMSHELRTPLNSILGFAQLLELYEPTDRQRSCIEKVLAGGKHLLGLIDEVLDISRIEAGHIEISRETVKIQHIVDEAISLTQPLASSRSVTVQMAPDIDPEIFAKADRQRLLQVIINLVSNGIKYNVEGGSVCIGIGVSNEVVAISVRDTGHGISKDLAHRVFMPFDRLGIEQRNQIEGTGLGLALSKSLVDAMRGSISYTSEIGMGSTFVVELERSLAPVIGASEILLHSNPTTEALDSRLVYIEDNESNIELIRSILRARPQWSLETAMTGVEGLDTILANPPDLVLLDLDLPDLSGLEVLRRIRANNALDSVPVLIVSADPTQNRVDGLLSAGANGYVMKPFDMRDLLDKISFQLSKDTRHAA